MAEISSGPVDPSGLPVQPGPVLTPGSPVLPGPVILFGSGETSTAGRKVYDDLFSRLGDAPRVVLLETPAGFELNSLRVISRVGEFIQERLQNYHPQVEVVRARQRGTPLSPDEPGILGPLRQADVLFLGPGSPTYAVRQLKDSLTWEVVRARHRQGAAMVLASAATIAIGAFALPVYEIYKVGEDLHWERGLNLFGSYGLNLVFVPHWNNADGGEELDTSRCFMGCERFNPLVEMLPYNMTIVGIDEMTALEINLQTHTCRVLGLGWVTVIRENVETSIETGQEFSLEMLGNLRVPAMREGVWGEAWRWLSEGPPAKPVEEPALPPQDVLDLLTQRQEARLHRDWDASDRLRKKIAELGWRVIDTPEGQKLEK